MRQLKTKNIGPAHPYFNHTQDESYTQVLVLDQSDEDRVCAQFFGYRSKLDAAQFILFEKLMGRNK